MFQSFLSFIILGFLLICPTAYGQVPHVSGNIYVSLIEGTFKADLDVSNLPKTSNYCIQLNSGLNVKFFRDSSDRFSYSVEREYHPEKSYESMQYWFPSNGSKDRYLPSHFKISYVGAFPIYADSIKRSEWGDWKGNIAFNGKTIRASEQSVWYPILYDISEDKTYSSVTYDLTIHVPGAKAIYLNGYPPQKGEKAHLQSNKPFPLLLFAGDFDFKKEQNTYLVNTSLSTGQAQVLDGWFTRIKEYYQTHLDIPYGIDVTLLTSTPISKRNDWMFVTYPTIASVSPINRLNTLVHPQSLTMVDSSQLSMLSHELGHYYFGTVFRPNSTLYWAFLEGMTEYISLQSTRDLIGEKYYKHLINHYVNASRGLKQFKPLKEITKPDQINETYRYEYVPLLLTALEAKIGRPQMWKWIRYILQAQQPLTNYAFFKESLLQSGVDERTFEALEKQYLSSETSLANLLAEFTKTPHPSELKYYWANVGQRQASNETTKPQVIYTSIKRVKAGEDMDTIARQYFEQVKAKYPDEQNIFSNFNTYETLEQAREAQKKSIKKLESTHEVKQEDI
ncbi:hypothetical protein [Siphonobacter sp. SORGH_AS_1065]|uniref:hypothetical protein n=1 Tax=Siphonobacter sp. SORGH_AS_1065 TaxID=3041795 RepID=UPI002781D99F|nr:hypothetical protein [Siphonobacter sp. SORGH_AS_1065]MDQ1086661.1 hypothetical protein [Siphonobacter sp. SORGH_AS_1065]